MLRIRSKLSSKGQVTIPSKVRKTLGVSPEDQIIFVIREDGCVQLERSEERALEELKGIFPDLSRPTSSDFSVEIREAMEERAQQIVDRMNGR
jgi:AbrB family looped-hinge helix DNA binding protein